MKRETREGIYFGLLVLGLWLSRHRVLLGYWALILLALACDAGLLWLAVQSARVDGVGAV